MSKWGGWSYNGSREKSEGDGCPYLREPVKLEVNPKKKKLAIKLGFDESLTWAPHTCI